MAEVVENSQTWLRVKYIAAFPRNTHPDSTTYLRPTAAWRLDRLLVQPQEELMVTSTTADCLSQPYRQKPIAT